MWRTCALALLALSGCSYELAGPEAPTVETVEPGAFCNEIEGLGLITGTGFTPMPENVLPDPTLTLPDIVLFSGETPDDVSEAWQSSTAMSFELPIGMDEGTTEASLEIKLNLQ